jgi:limonene-1,2-epoxide hydrolase
VIDRREFVAATGAGLMLGSAASAGEKVMDTRFKQFTAVIDAWKRKDTDYIFAAMTDDIVWHYAAAVAPAAHGKAEARKFLAAFGPGVGAVRWRIFTHAETADRLFVEGVDEYDTPNGKTIIAPYCGVIEFRGDKISGWRDYVDRSVIDDQKAGKAVPAQITELVSRPVAR